MGLLNRLLAMVPGFTNSRPGTVPLERMRPSTDEKVPGGLLAGVGGKVWFLPYADNTSTGDTSEIRAAMRLMLRDPYIKAAWLSQVLTVLSQDFQVHHDDARKDERAQDAVDFVRHCIESVEGELVGLGIATLMNLGSDGMSLAEKCWGIEERHPKYKGRYILRALKPKNPDFLTLTGDQFRNVTGVKVMRTGEEYPISDFTYTRYLHTFDEPFGMAAFRAGYGAYWMRDTVRKLRVIRTEKADGLLIGEYEDPADKGPLETMLARAKISTWASIPTGVKINAIEKSKAAEPDFKSFDESLREESIISVALASLHILQGNVADGRGDTKVHKAVSDLGPWLLTYLVQTVINRQIIPDLITYNVPGLNVYPRVTLGGVTNEEILQQLQVLDGAQRAGFKPSRTHYAGALTIQEADPTDPTDQLAPPAPGPMPGGVPGLPGQSPPGGDPFGGAGFAEVPPKPSPFPGGHPLDAIGEAVLESLGISPARPFAAPPSGPPRPGLVWKDETHRWINPDADKPAEPSGASGGRAAATEHPAVKSAAQRITARIGEIAANVNAKLLAAGLTPAAIVGDQTSWETWFVTQHNDAVAHHLGVDAVTAANVLSHLVAHATDLVVRKLRERGQPHAERAKKYTEWKPYTNPKDGRQGWVSAGGLIRYSEPKNAPTVAPAGGPASPTFPVDRFAWLKFAEPLPTDEVAIAGKDGQRAAELLRAAKESGRATLARLTEQAVRRMLKDSDPLTVPVLFSDDELQELADSLAATTATADLLGRARIHRMADAARKRGTTFSRFDEWSPYAGPHGGQGWRNGSTGEIRYQTSRPEESGGGKPETGSSSQDQTKPIKDKKAVADRVKSVIDEAEKIPVTDEQIKSEPIGSRDYDAIENAMTGKEAAGMSSYLDAQRENWIEEEMNSYDPDEYLGSRAKKSAAEEAGWSDSDVRDKAIESVDALDSIDDDAKESVKEAIEEWYQDTSEANGEAVDELSNYLTGDHPDEAVKAVMGLYKDAERDTEEELEKKRDDLREEKRNELSDLYSDSDDRIEYLRDFYRDHEEEPRFRGEAEKKNVWGKDSDGDRMFVFDTSGGNVYELWAVSRVFDGQPVTEIGFNDSSGSYGITGAGGAHEVFARVTAAVTSLVLNENPPALSFTAAEPSRQRLYDRLVKALAAVNPDYSALAISAPDSPRRYVVVRRELKDGILEKLAAAGTTQPQVLVADERTAVVLAAELNLDWFTESGWVSRHRRFAEESPFAVFDDLTDPIPVVNPIEAIDYFRKLVPSLTLDPQRYGPRLDRHAFTMAAATDEAMLGKVKDIIQKKLQTGIGHASDVQAILDEAGVTPKNPQYAELVMRTNVLDSYNQGQTAELARPEMQDAFPVWQYLGIHDERAGEDHKPKFDRFYPNSAAFADVRGPRVFNCRCSQAPISKWEWAEMQKAGKQVETTW